MTLLLSIPHFRNDNNNHKNPFISASPSSQGRSRNFVLRNVSTLLTFAERASRNKLFSSRSLKRGEHPFIRLSINHLST